jgi:hypothetical protein
MGVKSTRGGKITDAPRWEDESGGIVASRVTNAALIDFERKREET